MDIETLINKLQKYNWSSEQVLLAIRAECKCEYCGKNMLENIDNYKLWQVDHIIPKSSGYGGCEEFDNKAIACTQCNKDIKGRWNPANTIGIGKTREEYINETKEYIKRRRDVKETELNEIKKLYYQFFTKTQKRTRA